jgi:iron complex outermembrane recepter protein
MHGTLRRGGLTAGFLIACLAICMTANAMAAEIVFEIEAGLAPSTLKQFAAQAHVQLLFDYKAVQSLKTPEVHGQLEPADALKILLQGSGFTFHQVNDHTIAVMATGSAHTTSNTPSADAPLVDDKEGKKNSSGGFRLAQVDNGAPSSSPTVTKTNVGVASRAADGPGESAPSSSNSNGLEEIIVTALRREENIQKVPMSVAAISQKVLDELHIQNLSDLESVVPGLVFTTPTVFNPNGQTDIAIRGIFSGGAGLSPTTQVYIDDTPIEEHIVGIAGVFSNPSLQLFDLDRVEVLRGPQGTLFGASTMGGAVRFITPQPSLTQTSGYAQGEMAYSPYGEPSYNLGIAYGAPVVDGVVGFRISAYYNDLGGYINQENPYTGALLATNINSQTSYVLRPALTIAPLEGLSITLSEYLQDIRLANMPIYWLNFLPVPQPGGQVATGSTQQQPTHDFMSIPALKIRYELPALTIESNTSYFHREYDNYTDMTHADEFYITGKAFVPGLSPSYSQFWDNFAWTNTLQEELRFTSKDEPDTRFHWIFGLFYRDASQRASQVLPGTVDAITEACCGVTSLQLFGIPNYVDSYSNVDASYTQFTNTDKETAAFGEISYDFTSRLKLSVGARVSHDTVESHQIGAGPLAAVTYSNNVLPTQVQNPVTPRFSLSYQVADQTMVYTTAAKGYRLGGDQFVGWTAAPACGPSLKLLPGVTPSNTYASDSLWSYELGAKSTLFNNRLQIDASIYYIDWSNIQTSVPVASCLDSFVANFGKAVSKGGDLQLNLALTEHLTVGATGGYTDAYYAKTEIIGQALLAQEGERLPNVPPWNVASNLVYRRALSFLSDTNGYARVDFRHISAMPQLNPAIATYDPALGPRQDPAYSTLNLRIGVVHGGLDASAFVDNATNADPLLGYFHFGLGDPLFQATMIRPLTTGITLRYSF